MQKKVKKTLRGVRRKLPKEKDVDLTDDAPSGVVNDYLRRIGKLDDKPLKTGPKPGSVMSIVNIRKVFLDVFHMMGGLEEFKRWATWSNSNQSEFYKLFGRMLPKEVHITDGDVRPNDLSGLKDEELDRIITKHITRK